MQDELRNNWHFPCCPTPPEWVLDWETIVHRFELVQALAGCAQEGEWHREGDVLTHTRLVCEALANSDEWRSLRCLERSVVFAATLLHDVGKPATTRHESGRVTARGHARQGAYRTRTMLMRDVLPTASVSHLRVREQIVGLVRHHGVPLHLLDDADLQRRVFAISHATRCDWLAMLAGADVAGRVCAGQQELLDRVRLFGDYCTEQGCYDTPRRFASGHTRFVYFQGRDLDPDIEVFDDTQAEVTLMSGLPGAGKDRWIREHGGGLPVVSLDEIRRGLKVSPENDQGAVVKQAKDMAREHLRKGRSFIWNATNATLSMRRQLVGLFTQYRARVRIVYVEAPWATLLERNRRRPLSVPERVMIALANKLDVPLPPEAQIVEYHVSM